MPFSCSGCSPQRHTAEVLSSCVQATASSSMMYEDRLEAAHRRRLAGNDLFAAKTYGQALSQYALAQDCLNEDFMMQAGCVSVGFCLQLGVNALTACSAAAAGGQAPGQGQRRAAAYSAKYCSLPSSAEGLVCRHLLLLRGTPFVGPLASALTGLTSISCS